MRAGFRYLVMGFERQTGLLSLRRAGIGPFFRYASTPLLCWQQTAPDHVQVGQRKHGEQTRRVLRQAAIAHLGKAPQLLHDSKGVLAPSPSGGAQAVQRLPMLAERLTRIAPPVDPIAHTVLLR